MFSLLSSYKIHRRPERLRAKPFSRILFDDRLTLAQELKRLPLHFAGDIKQKYGTAEAPAVTALQSLASSSTFLAGWTSAWIDNTTTLALNSTVSAQIMSGTTPTAGSIRAYVYAEHPDGTDPALFSAGTAGVEGTATVHDSEILEGSMTLIWSSSVDTTSDQAHNMPPRSIRQAFGFMPRKWALFIAHDTVATLKSSGSFVHVDHEIAQYT